MHVNNIQIPGWLYQKLELEILTYIEKQQAIEVLKSAFEKNDIEYSIKEEDNRTSFQNEHGGELAVVVLAR